MIAQLVEQWTENPCVAGSTPARTTKILIRRISHVYLKVQGTIIFIKAIAGIWRRDSNSTTPALLSLSDPTHHFQQYIMNALKQKWDLFYERNTLKLLRGEDL